MLASQIYVVAENLKDKKANFYILDRGEGQSPSNFKTTFLKFGGNKANTYFVHGRFGTGSFGVLPNCGDNKYQIILSKSFQSSENKTGEWGWTLIRKNRPKDLETKHAWYEYLTNEGNMHSFSETDISEIIKKTIGYDRLDLSDYQYGTIIKLYDYDLPNSFDIDRDLYRIVNRYLFAPALPFRILDAQGKGHVGPGKEVDGNLNRFKKNKSELEGLGELPTLKIQRVLFPKLGYVDIDIYVSKKKSNKKGFIESERVSNNNEAVFFIRNGQSHGEFSRHFIRDDLGLEYISKDIAIYIDCSNTPSVEFDDVFPPTRDSLRENRHRNSVEDTLRNELKNHEGLKDLNSKRRSSIIAENIEKTKDFETFINDLYSLDPALRKLLSGSLKITDLSKKGTKSDDEYVGSVFPTFLNIKDNDVKNNGYKSLPANSYARIIFETDAQNDYLYRQKDGGKLIFDFKGKVSSYKLYNGRLTLKVLPPETGTFLVNTKDNFKIVLSRPYSDPLIQEFKVKYVPAIEPGTNPPPPPPPPKTKQLILPKPNFYSREQWLALGYDERDACEFAVERDDANSYYILKEVNMHADFPFLIDFIRSQGFSDGKVTEMKQMFLQALYMSSLVVHKDFSADHSYKRDDVRVVMTQLAKSLPFTLFTMQKKWLKSLISPE